MRLAPFLGVAIWSLLIWKIWTRPRNWGLGVGIFHFVLIVFQTYLLFRAIEHFNLDVHSASNDLKRHFRHELPSFAAGVFCILLRFIYPKELKAIAKK
jgi:hypothetical protein